WDTARLRVILIDDRGLRQRSVFVARAVVHCQTRRDAELILSIETEVADGGVRRSIAERLRVARPALSTCRIPGEIQGKIGDVRVSVASEPIDHRLGIIVAIRDIGAEFERVLAGCPGKVVGELESLLARLDAWQRRRAC